MEPLTIVINCSVCDIPLNAGEGLLDAVLGLADGDVCIWTCPVCGREYVRRDQVTNEIEA